MDLALVAILAGDLDEVVGIVGVDGEHARFPAVIASDQTVGPLRRIGYLVMDAPAAELNRVFRILHGILQPPFFALGPSHPQKGAKNIYS